MKLSDFLSKSMILQKFKSQVWSPNWR